MQSLDAFLQFKSRFHSIRDNIPSGEMREKFVDYYIDDGAKNWDDDQFDQNFTKDQALKYESAFKDYWNHVYDEWYFYKKNGTGHRKIMTDHWNDYFGPATATSLDLSGDKRAFAYYLVFLKQVEEDHWPYGGTLHKKEFLEDIRLQLKKRCAVKKSILPEKQNNFVFTLPTLLKNNTHKVEIDKYFTELRQNNRK